MAEEEEEVVEEEEEPAAPAQHADARHGPEQPAVEEELVVSKEPENGSGQILRNYIQNGDNRRRGKELVLTLGKD